MLPNPIFGIFHMYGLMIAVGILACFGVLFYFGRKKKIEESFIDFVFYNAIVAILLGFGAAALFQATYDYIENPSAGFKFGGITFIGGLIGGIVSFLAGYAIFRKKYKNRLVDIISIAPCCILIAHAFGRVGCFCAGCCYGKPTDSFLGVEFPDVSGGPRHPTQLYEAIFLFALFAICWLLYWKKHFKYNLSLYLIVYGIFRFSIEYLRDDHRGELLGGISPSQFWSLLMIVSGVGVYFLLKYLFEKREEELVALAGEASNEVTMVEGSENELPVKAEEVSVDESAELPVENETEVEK